MKTLVAVLAVLVSTNSFAFFDDARTNAMGNGAHVANGDVVGNGNAEGEASFTMSFSGKGRTAGDFKGKGNTDTNTAFGGASATEYRPYGYGSPYYYNNAEK